MYILKLVGLFIRHPLLSADISRLKYTGTGYMVFLSVSLDIDRSDSTILTYRYSEAHFYEGEKGKERDRLGARRSRRSGARTLSNLRGPSALLRNH